MLLVLQATIVPNSKNMLPNTTGYLRAIFELSSLSNSGVIREFGRARCTRRGHMRHPKVTFALSKHWIFLTQHATFVPSLKFLAYLIL
jgi:hypothetical protein